MANSSAHCRSTTISSAFLRLGLLILTLLAAPIASASVFVSVGFAPPPLPVYVQPVCPGPGYIWTPGYWAYGPEGYYWVPGTWVLAPFIGALWTPGYWGWDGVAFAWHAGYWGPHVGFYGGIDYGFGYFGLGYAGGHWSGRSFSYNTAISHVDVTRIHNTYREAAPAAAAMTRVSYNGGTGGVSAQPTAAQRQAQSERHTPATQLQVRHEQLAGDNRALLASVNHGTPSLTATSLPAAFASAGAQAHVAGAPGTHRASLSGPQHAQAQRQPSHAQQHAQHYVPSAQQHAQAQRQPGYAPQRVQHYVPSAQQHAQMERQFNQEQPRMRQYTPASQPAQMQPHYGQRSPSYGFNAPHSASPMQQQVQPPMQHFAQSAPRVQAPAARGGERHEEHRMN